MFNYIKAEIYRIFTKKSMYIYFATLLILYILYIFIRSKVLTESSIFAEASQVFFFLSLFGGGYLFATIYNDDLNAKSLPTLIGFGMKRSVIIISKMTINVVMTLLMFFSACIAFYLIFYVIGLKMDNNMINDVLELMFSYLFRLFAYSSIASVVVYGTQKATMAMVTFILLVTMFVDQVLITFLNDALGEIFIVILIVGKLISNLSVVTVISYLVYVVVFIVLSILAFRKKELEF
jgi:ABC-type transport system involved in multi-copper enzyme maturation permease subunit